ncbi:MAG: 4Fe-4S binding protein [Clostridia bacterium]|nr:4Fe-4S binding protein [Clostridia bacterium]
MRVLENRLKEELTAMGASLVGFADLGDLPEKTRDGFRYGVSIAAAINPGVIHGIINGPTKEYYAEFEKLNEMLDCMDLRGAEILKEFGFNAYPKTRSNVTTDPATHSTILPHKTVATRAGLGWIGKCAVLVTQEFGSAVRISSILTDAPLTTGNPINESKCGNCNLCAESCPAGAATGELWNVGVKRDSFFNPHKCKETAQKRAAQVALGYTLCGLCIRVCPWTRKYIEKNGISDSGENVFEGR